MVGNKILVALDRSSQATIIFQTAIAKSCIPLTFLLIFSHVTNYAVTDCTKKSSIAFLSIGLENQYP
jgi:hypothetical protein